MAHSPSLPHPLHPRLADSELRQERVAAYRATFAALAAEEEKAFLAKKAALA